MPVVFGIPFGVVNAVHDAAEVRGARSQQGVQAEAELGRLDLSRIAVADGVNCVRKNNPALQQVDITVKPMAPSGGASAASKPICTPSAAEKIP